MGQTFVDRVGCLEMHTKTLAGTLLKAVIWRTEDEMETDGHGSGLCLMTGFDINGVKPSVSVTKFVAKRGTSGVKNLGNRNIRI